MGWREVGVVVCAASLGACGRQSASGLTAAPDAVDRGVLEAGTPATEGGLKTNDAGFLETNDGGFDAEATITFDLGADFSFTSNPSGPWRYGYTSASSLDPSTVRLDTFVPGVGVGGGVDAISFWHPFAPATLTSGYYPYVAENWGDASASEEASWALRPHEVAMEASNSGQYSVVEFVARLAGTYRMQVHFEGIHFRLSTTDVHVLAGDAGLFASDISGYGGDPAFHMVEGSNPSADYAGSVWLQAGDVLTFAVGYGTNMTNYNDTTGLTVHIVYTAN